MKVLVINCGSSSLKYQVLDMTNEALLCKGLVERIGMEGSVITHEKIGMDKVKNVVPMNDHKDAIEQVLDAVQNAEYGVVASMDEIGAVGHRVLHGGDKLSGSILITDEAKAEIERLTALGYGDLPVCMAKTQYSFSDDATKLGAPDGFTVTVRKIKVSAGAGFIVALTGNIMTMPGLPKVPAAERIDVDENGKITGLF